MNVNNAELIISAVSSKQYPNVSLPEIAFAGRSNVGKSSLINRLVNRKKLARTSSSPGKTATLNFYKIENAVYFVDLPGYGYAKVSWNERQRWADMINEYLEKSRQLKAIFQLVDARHNPTKDDITMFDWIKASGLDYMVIATKTDKLGKTAVEKNKLNICEALGVGEDRVIMFSSETGLGKDDVWDYIDNKVISKEEF